ncbi:MAG: amino acid permease [Pseudonocardia sp.]|nr:amino acid permease [Pseudonocardia sp.]
MDPSLDHTKTAADVGDEALLERFGYKKELPRILRFWTSWALGFAFISPIVGLYTVVALGAQTAGPAWVWAIPVVVIGQLLVGFVFMELAVRWPIAGGIYQWSRRLAGPAYGWWSGWFYMWALVLTLSTVAYSGGFFLGQLLGVDTSSPTVGVVLALVMMGLLTAVNAIGLNLLRWVVNVGIACELVASVGIGATLISFFRKQPVSVLVDTHATPGNVAFFPAFIAAVGIAGWVILGFDSCGSVAEETQNPTREVPRAILISLLTVGVVDMLAATALVLASPDIGAVLSGQVADPVSAAVVAGLGAWAEKPFLVVVVLAFVACGIAVQATGVRVVYSYARDGMIPLSRIWRKISQLNQTPVAAVLFVAVFASLAFTYANVLSVLVAFATGAYYVGFLSPVIAFLIRRLREPRRGPRSAPDVVAVVVNLAAAAWLIFELVNIAWPRSATLPWYQNWAVPLGMLIFGAVGASYYLATRPDLALADDQQGGSQG